MMKEWGLSGNAQTIWVEKESKNNINMVPHTERNGRGLTSELFIQGKNGRKDKYHRSIKLEK